mmetsp:Transcript_50136/g.121482  ORF Transcript_50136/g.121482 Transcript_50136/m.121482 type:complete len:600 (-) Transcript_50136:2-1801(-)
MVRVSAKRLLPNRVATTVAILVVAVRMCDSDTSDGYSQVWGLSFLRDSTFHENQGDGHQGDQLASRRRHLQQRQQSTCTFSSGRVYQPGQVIDEEDFTTRCGSAEEYPCYCSPDRTPFPVQCPYCSLVDTSSPNGVTCAKNGQTVTVVNTNNIQNLVQECSCSIEVTTGTPIETCLEVVEEPEETPDNVDGDGGGGDTGGGDSGNDTCTVELFDGRSVTLQEGESYGVFFPTRCTNEEGTGLGGGLDSIQFECFCNPSLPGQVECPFCTFVDTQGDLLCANSLETVSFVDPDLGPVECACFNDLTSTCRPVSPTESPVPVTTPLPTPPPPTTTIPSTQTPTVSTRQPTPSPVTPPTMIPNNPETGDDDGDFFDKSSGKKPLDDDPSLGGCLYHNPYENTIEFLEEGGIFDDRIASGPCSPTSDWPVFCNPAVADTNGMEYPYCVFSASNVIGGDSDAASARSSPTYVVCARSEERVTVTSHDGTSQECSCLYFNPVLGPVSSCELVSVDVKVTLPPTDVPSMIDNENPNDDNFNTIWTPVDGDNNGGGNNGNAPTLSIGDGEETSTDNESDSASAERIRRNNSFNFSIFVLAASIILSI